MAHVFVRHGLEAALAMSYNAMDSTTEFFIGFLYTHLIVFQSSLEIAIAKARVQLYETDKREVTLAETVSITDFFVPTLYRRPTFRSAEFKAPQRLADMESKSLAELFQYAVGLESFMEPLDLVGRTEDVSEIETLMEVCPIILLHGLGGIGKSELIRHLMWWWPATSLVQRVIHIDLARDALELAIEDCIADGLTEEDMEERRLALVIRKLIQEPQDGTETMRKLVIDFFDKHSCLLIIDSLEILDKDDTSHEHDRVAREFLERLVEHNEGGFAVKNSYVILSSRRDNVFGWEANGDIGGYHLSGLPLYHALQYGHRVLRRLYGKDGPQFNDDHDTKAHLEHVVQILDGNPLAIEIVFPIFGYSDVTPTRVVQQLLTGSAVPPAEGQLGGQILKRWAEIETGMHSRFAQDIMQTLERSQQLHHGERMDDFVLLLGLWNCVFPRAIDAQLVFFRARAGAGNSELPVRRAELMMKTEKDLGDINVFPGDKVDGILSDLVREGMVSPIRRETLLVKKYETEYYAIHPVLTLYLRIYLKNFMEAAGEIGRNIGMSLVGYRLLFDSMYARHCIENVPSGQHDEGKIRSFEENGRWNFMAAIMHATLFCKDKPVEPGSVSPVARLITVMSSLMGDFPEVTAVIRPYLSAELVRHLQSDLIVDDEDVLYGAVKLAFAMKNGAPLRTWQLIEDTMDYVDLYRAMGKTYSGYLEVSYMETRTTAATSSLDLDRKLAIRQFERNLRYEPCSNDSALQSIKRDVLKNLRYWVLAMIVQSAEDGKEAKGLPTAAAQGQDMTGTTEMAEETGDDEGNSKEQEKKEAKTRRAAEDEQAGERAKGKASSSAEAFGLDPAGELVPQVNSNFVQKWWSDSVRNAILFDCLPSSVQQHALQTFSPLAVSMLDEPQWATVTDLAPDVAALLAFHNGELGQFHKSSYAVALRAHIQMQEGDAEAVRRVYREGLERQMRESNDAVTNLFIHQELQKLAMLDGQWLTAARHLENEIKLSPGGGLFRAYLELAQCYEKVGRTEEARTAAIGAYESVRTHPSTPGGESGHRLVMSCNREMRNLAGIKDFGFVYPKRCRWGREGDETAEEKDDEDKVHLVMLLWDDALLSHALRGNTVVSDGKRLQKVVEAVFEYGKAVAASTAEEVGLQQRQVFISARLERILADVGGLVAEMKKRVDESSEEGVAERREAIYAEAERVLFAKKKPELDVLRDSAWAAAVLDARFRPAM